MRADSTLFSPAGAADLLERLAAGYALPSTWYTDRAIFDVERDVILRRGWHFGAHKGQLARPGDRAATTVAGVPVALAVDEDGAIAGLVDVGLPGPQAPVQTAVWGPTVWVNLDRDAPPFERWTDGLSDVVAGHGIDVDDHAFALERTWEIPANWKVFLDNAIECYHCPTCHSALSQVLEMDPATHDLAVGGRYWISHRIPLRRTAVGTPVAAPTAHDGDDPGHYYFHWIFPTTYFQYAGRGFDVGTVDVRGVDRIVFRHLAFMPSDATAEEIAERDARLDEDPTVDEDVAICTRVQLAHGTGAAPTGRLLPRSEWLLQHFQRVLVEDVEAGGPDVMRRIAA